jgi:membrane-associated phospholipid phosphatase
VYLLVFAVIAGWLLWRRLPRLALFVAVTVGVNPLLNELVKLLVHRSRPVVADLIVQHRGHQAPPRHHRRQISQPVP